MSATRGVPIGTGHRLTDVPTTWNGAGQLPRGWYDPAAPGSYKPSFGLIHWDAWYYGVENNPSLPYMNTLHASYTHRQPLDFDPVFVASDASLVHVSLAREQQICDNLLDKYNAAGVGWIAFDWFPPLEVQDTTTYPYEVGAEQLVRFWQRYQDSTHKGGVKWCWIIQDSWLAGGAHYDTLLSWIANSVDGNYYRVAARNKPVRPVVVLFFTSAAVTPWSAAAITKVRNAFLAAGKGDPYIIGQGSTNANWISWGADARTGYGPLDCVPAGAANAHVAFGALDTKLQAVTWFTSGSLNAVPHCSSRADPRCIGYAQPWSDPATASQWITHIKAANSFITTNPTNCPANSILCYAGTEIAEWDAIQPTAQNDVHGTGLGAYLDGVAHWQGITPRTQVVDRHTPQNATAGFITMAGTWTWSNAVAGAFDSMTSASSTAGDTIKLTRTTVANGKMRLYGKKGPDQGIVAVDIDGGAPTNVDCYSPTPQQFQLLYTSAALTAAAHTMTATVTGTKNGSASAVTITIDCLEAEVAAP